MTILLPNLQDIILARIMRYIPPNYNVIMRRNQEVSPNKKAEIVALQLCDAIMHSIIDNKV